jgi:hypothetical protein
MSINQSIEASLLDSNVYALPKQDFTAPVAQREKGFRKLLSQVQKHNRIQSYLLKEDREVTIFARSNKANRKLENMVDVINFSLFDFELMFERYQNSRLSRLLEDIISILKCTKITISQAVIESCIDFKACCDSFIMAIYAAIKAIGSLMSMMDIVSARLLDDLENMQASLVYAIDEHLGS